MKLSIACVALTLSLIYACSPERSNPQSTGSAPASPVDSTNGGTLTQASESSIPAIDQIPPKPQDLIYVIFDASGSMHERLRDGTTRLSTAKRVLNEFLGGDFQGYDLALRIYGHRRKDDCTDSELAFPPGADANSMKQFVAKLNALGRTPITFSLTEALKDFGERGGEIILISDGIESCNADPCALVREWRQRNVKIRLHVVGLGLDEKSRQALKCISEAAGTEYQDADSAATLADSLSKIREGAVARGFRLKGIDREGNHVPVEGILMRAGTQPIRVSSSRAYQLDEGEYEVTAGVKTANGNLYRPVKQKVTVTSSKTTTVAVHVDLPPRVKAKFVESGTQQRGANIRAFQNGREVFGFRPVDEVFLDEGRYDFQATPNSANELTVSESFAAGDRKEILFGMARTVVVRFRVIAAGSGTLFRENTELWQGGELKYAVHQTNGARVVPGTYDFRLPNPLTPHEKRGILVTDQAEQQFEIVVPVGHVTFIYQTSIGAKDKDDRCFLSRADGNQSIYKMSGQKIPMTPGRYRVEGWKQKGAYSPVTFDVREGEERIVILKAQ